MAGKLKSPTGAMLKRYADRERVKGAVLKSGLLGISWRSLSKLLNIGESAMLAHLRDLERDGIIEKSGAGGGFGCVWGAIGIQAATTAAREQRAALRARNAAARAQSRQRGRDSAARREEAERQAHAWSEARPVHRIVSACEATRLPITGPKSVFAVGAMQ